MHPVRGGDAAAAAGDPPGAPAGRPPARLSPSLHPPVRRSPAFAFFCAYALFVAYATLLPFRFSTDGMPLHERMHWINWNPFRLVTGEPTPIADVVMNVVFFVPFGFIAFHAQRPRPVRTRVLRATVAGMLLSTVVEVLQFFTPTRNPATSDVLTNAGGAAIGALLAALFQLQFERRLRRCAMAWTAREPLLPVLVGCAVLVTISALVPFDIAASMNWIKRGIRLVELDPRQGPLDWTDLARAIVQYAMLGGLAVQVTARIGPTRRGARTLACWAGPVALGAALEIAQILVRSRVCSTRDVLAAAVGATLGCGLGLCLVGTSRARHGWALAALGSLACLSIQALAPFRLQLDFAAMMERLRPTALVPYATYYYKATVAAVADFLDGLLAYVPLAFVMARHRARSSRLRLADALRVVGWCTLFAFVLEVLQLGLPRRYPEISDVLTAALGAALGASAWRWFAQLGGAASPHQTNGPAATRSRSQAASPWDADGDPVGEPIAPASS